jgi:hypothetical protein
LSVVVVARVAPVIITARAVVFIAMRAVVFLSGKGIRRAGRWRCFGRSDSLSAQARLGVFRSVTRGCLIKNCH